MSVRARGVAILGATGSIGGSTLSVVRENPGRFTVTALAARAQWEPMVALAREFRPAVLALSDEAAAVRLRRALPLDLRSRVVGGPGALDEAAVAPGTDIALCACSGAAGLTSAVAALRAGIDLALANKEVLVAGGALVTGLARRHRARILPVDSEHSAIFQCIRGEGRAVERIMLTASGGPFRGRSRRQLARVTPAEALRHPKWSMGPKITIDSATLMNKGLEVIEARWLFSLPIERVEVVVHPQSIVHSLVEFRDRSVLAQLGLPDMRLPIQYALTYPRREEAPYLERLDLARLATLTFEPPDRRTFGCLDLACRAGTAGGLAPAVLNAANEVAVAAFLEGRAGFLDIERVVSETLDEHLGGPATDVEAVLDADRWARERARRAVQGLRRR